MSEKRISVWVQQFKDRPTLMLRWIDPDTGRRKSRGAGTADEKEAEGKRVDLESDLNNRRYQETSRVTLHVTPSPPPRKTRPLVATQSPVPVRLGP
jgi:hypothetical protein